MAVSAVRRAITEFKQRQSLDGWPKIYYLELLRASEGTLSRGSRLHLQSLAPTNLHRARVVGYGPFSLCSSGDINDYDDDEIIVSASNAFTSIRNTKQIRHAFLASHQIIQV
jgi:hypothetical protein